MRLKFKTVDEFIDGCPEQARPALRQLRQIIRSILPQAQETISYNIPCYKIDGKYVIYFAGFAKHVSIYPIPEGDAQFGRKINSYIKGKGTLQFKLTDPLPQELIKEVVYLAKIAAGHRETNYRS